MYTVPSYITEKVGNNIFSYDIRENKMLYIPSVIDGTFSQIQIGDKVVFEDKNDSGALESCYGLENFVRMHWEGIPVVIFDNHNHALYFWYEAYFRGILASQNTLVHIDEHSDLWSNENDIRENPTLKQMFNFTNYSCNVGNYIQPAIRAGFIGSVLRIEDTIGMEKYALYQKESNEKMILNLDLDFFAPELDYISFEDKKKTILHFARQSDFITIATSPFFIDQKRAIEMFRRVFFE